MKNIQLSTAIFKITGMCFFFIISLGISTLNAQRVPGEIGIGFQAGQPSGLSMKIYQQRTSWDILAAWDLDDFFFLNIHGVRDKHLNEQNTIHLFYGPGGFIGIRDRSDREDDIALGISGTLGIDFIIDKVELFGQITPRLELIEETDFDIGGGIGLRVYF